ncbi:hypothetical protein EDD86DRAFT_175432, partial [Gorgonomyces haynaldii]
IPDALLMQLRQHELDGYHYAEAGDIEKAVQEFTVCIQKCPEYASAYNNRAQAYRLLNDDLSALKDCDKAIELGTGQQTTLMQAYTQRAVIHRKLGNTKEAERDFQQGAQFGNPLARGVIKNNPYAKLCNQMVAEAMAKL